MTLSADDRLTALEMRFAEQERTVDELSAEIARQWTVIERLEKTLDALGQRFVALEEQATPRPEATRPPHW
ncbi:MAG: SlyX family protein [Mesorhizobium sp.]|jgi:SlyX protein